MILFLPDEKMSKPSSSLPSLSMPSNISEYGKVALWSLVPGAGGVACMAAFFSNKDAVEWWNRQRKPKWAPKDDRVYMAVDLLTSSPLGCASYLVYKHGSGFDYMDTRVALGAYAAHLALAFGSFPLFISKRDPKLNTIFSVGLFATAGLTAALFYKIHPKAGLMLVPYTLWNGFYVVLMYKIWSYGKKPYDDL